MIPMTAPQPDPQPDSIEVYYQKANFFRVVHADGCYGGVNARGMIHCGFYSERAAFPLRTALPVQDGRPGPEKVIESKSGLVREFEVDVIMDINTGVAFYVWLRDKLDNLRKQLGVSDEQWESKVRGTKG
jgi:hypothetical protein